MAPKKQVVPDAWEDEDWESAADRLPPPPPATTAQSTPQDALDSLVSKAERLALHAESNRRLWENAETPDTPYHIQALQLKAPPLKQDFKPALKMLARRPAGSEETEDEEALRRNAVTSEERRIQAQKEREEKQRKYEEVRARLFGAESNVGAASNGRAGASGTSSPGGTGSEGEGTRGGRRGRGRGRGANLSARAVVSEREAQSSGQRTLFDPGYTPKPGTVALQRRGNEGQSSGNTTPIARAEEQIIRTPKGPSGDGRGGFGFSNRGARAG